MITKLLGKKQFSKLSFFEYIVGITIGDIAGTLSMDMELNFTNGIMSLLIWSLVPLLISHFSLRYKKFREVVEGTPTIFIQNGKILEGNLEKEKYTVDELMEQIRKQSVFHLSDLEYASLEPTGEISILLKKSKQSITYGDIFSRSPIIREPHNVITEGIIDDETLAKIGLNRGWLMEEIDKLGVDMENVFFAQVDSYFKLTVDLYEDHIS